MVVWGGRGSPPPPPPQWGATDAQTAHHATSSTAPAHQPSRTRKRHQQEHGPQRLIERSNPTQHAKGRTGDCPGLRKETTTRRNVTQGVSPPPPPLLCPYGLTPPNLPRAVQQMNNLCQGCTARVCDLVGSQIEGLNNCTVLKTLGQSAASIIPNPVVHEVNGCQRPVLPQTRGNGLTAVWANAVGAQFQRRECSVCAEDRSECVAPIISDTVRSEVKDPQCCVGSKPLKGPRHGGGNLSRLCRKKKDGNNLLPSEGHPKVGRCLRHVRWRMQKHWVRNGVPQSNKTGTAHRHPITEQRGPEKRRGENAGPDKDTEGQRVVRSVIGVTGDYVGAWGLIGGGGGAQDITQGHQPPCRSLVMCKAWTKHSKRPLLSMRRQLLLAGYLMPMIGSHCPCQPHPHTHSPSCIMGHIFLAKCPSFWDVHC